MTLCDFAVTVTGDVTAIATAAVETGTAASGGVQASKHGQPLTFGTQAR